MMNVIFISESTSKGKKRVNAVLDRYAIRVGNETWMTPITQKGLDVVLLTLKNIATKQVHVSCFKKTPLGNKLIFSVGKSINREGDAISVHSHKKKQNINIPHYLKDATILTKLAGLFHDLGKLNLDFQKKIRLTQEQINKDKTLLSDNVRHELISYYLFNIFEKNIDIGFIDAWNKAEMEINLFNEELINKPIEKWEDLVRFIILTHHKLPTNNIEYGNQFSLNKSNTLLPYYKNKIQPDNISISFNHNNLFQIENIIKEIRFILKRLKNKKLSKNPDYWFSLSFLCRSHFILSDQEQSSISLNYNNEIVNRTDDTIYANTHINGKNERVYFNQTLDWHLKNVSERSSQLLYEIHTMKNKGLNKNIQKSLLVKTDNDRFKWQNNIIDYSKLKTENSQYLILNVAGTGRGKTRSNVSTLAALNSQRNDNKPFRFTTLLNLKTLTLQTIDAYKEQLHIPNSEILGIIGDKQLMKLHDSEKDVISTLLQSDELNKDDEDDIFDDIEIVSYGNIETPPFLDLILDKSIIKENKKINLKKNNNQAKMLSAPVVVSTIDFIINAGDITKQKKHALALLRIMNSDLILDEIDSYDPKALVAVSRVIMLSAMFGNNVVASSATLSEGCAELVFNAFQKGVKLRSSMLSEQIKSSALIFDDRTEIEDINIFVDKEEFLTFYNGHLKLYFDIKTPICKIGEILKFEKNEVGLLKSLADKIIDFHNFWNNDSFNKKLSFGLIRIANINQAVHVAKHLSSCDILKDKIKICCYHSQLTFGQRYYVEKNLDFLLKRGKKEENYTHSKMLKNLSDSHLDKDLILIVVATSVEEIGRDHDFDWCICEPSSTQSIIQTAGRINRHREIEVNRPNIAILNYNFRDIRGEDNVFCRPGLDQNTLFLENGNITKKDLFSSKKIKQKKLLNYRTYSKNYLNLQDVSMTNLLSENEINQKIDASLKFGKIDGIEVHKFSFLDNLFIKKQLEDVFKIYNDDQYVFHFFNQSFYQNYKLRDKVGLDLSLDVQSHYLYYKDHETKINLNLEPDINNSFLNPLNDIEEYKKIKSIMLKNQINSNLVRFSLYNSDNFISKIEKYCFHPTFGFYMDI